MINWVQRRESTLPRSDLVHEPESDGQVGQRFSKFAHQNVHERSPRRDALVKRNTLELELLWGVSTDVVGSAPQRPVEVELFRAIGICLKHTQQVPDIGLTGSLGQQRKRRVDECEHLFVTTCNESPKCATDIKNYYAHSATCVLITSLPLILSTWKVQVHGDRLGRPTQ